MKKKKIIILGAGGTGGEIVEIIKDINSKKEKFQAFGFLDDDGNLLKKNGPHNLNILGKISDAKYFKDCFFINSIGSPQDLKLRERIFVKSGITLDRYITLIHPSSRIPSSAKIGNGVLIMPHVVVGYDCKIDEHCILTYSSSLGHEAKLKKNVILASGVNISGKVKIGSSCYIGAGTVTSHNIEIGSNTLVSAGSTIIKNLPKNGKYIYAEKSRFIK